jgi:hypothetical protein
MAIGGIPRARDGNADSRKSHERVTRDDWTGHVPSRRRVPRLTAMEVSFQYHQLSRMFERVVTVLADRVRS